MVKAALAASALIKMWYICARAQRLCKKGLLLRKLLKWHHLTKMTRVAGMMMNRQKKRSTHAVTRAVTHVWRAHARAIRCSRLRNSKLMRECMHAWGMLRRVIRGEQQVCLATAFEAWGLIMTFVTDSASHSDALASRKLVLKILRGWHRHIVVCRAVRIICGDACAARALQAWRCGSIKQGKTRVAFVEALIKGKRRAFAAWTVYTEMSKEDRANMWHAVIVVRKMTQAWHHLCQVHKVMHHYPRT
jgi:hypothetical protein